MTAQIKLSIIVLFSQSISPLKRWLQKVKHISLCSALLYPYKCKACKEFSTICYNSFLFSSREEWYELKVSCSTKQKKFNFNNFNWHTLKTAFSKIGMSWQPQKPLYFLEKKVQWTRITHFTDTQFGKFPRLSLKEVKPSRLCRCRGHKVTTLSPRPWHLIHAQLCKRNI